MGRSVLKIITAQKADDFNAVGVAMGLGNLATVPLGAPGNGTITHYLGNDESMSEALAQIMLAMVEQGGQPPENDINEDPIVWGENGLISWANAKAALAAAQIYVGANVVATEHAGGILQGRTLEIKEIEI